MAFPAALKEKEEVREGEAEEKKGKKKPPFMKKGKKKGSKKDTEIEKGAVANEGVTKANRSPMPTLDSLTAASFRDDGCGCNHKKDAAKADGKGCGSKRDKKKSVWADGFEVNDAAFVLTQGSDKLATEKYAREKRKRNAQSQPHNIIYANTFNT